MTARLPMISGREAVRAFEKAGFGVLVGRGKGSHVVMVRGDWPGILTIPDHRELKRGLLRALVKQAGLTIEEFVELL